MNKYTNSDVPSWSDTHKNETVAVPPDLVRSRSAPADWRTKRIVVLLVYSELSAEFRQCSECDLLCFGHRGEYVDDETVLALLYLKSQFLCFIRLRRSAPYRSCNETRCHPSAGAPLYLSSGLYISLF